MILTKWLLSITAERINHIVGYEFFSFHQDCLLQILQFAKFVVTMNKEAIVTIISVIVFTKRATSMVHHILGPPCHLEWVLWGGGGDNKRLILPGVFCCHLTSFFGGGCCVMKACSDSCSS